MQRNDYLSKDVISKLKSIERRQVQISKEINDLGFEVYLSCDGMNILNGPHHDGKYYDACIDNVVWNIHLKGTWDGGDW